MLIKNLSLLKSLAQPKKQIKPSYGSLLTSSLNCIGNKEYLIEELSLKKIISQNTEMKKIIFKMAQVAVNEQFQKHPFVSTAGEVFFGGENDILTPGILVLLLNRLVNSNRNYDDSHLLLAKGLIETTTGYQIHRTIQEITSDCQDSKTLHQGNKLATLTGDLLVVSLIKNVAKTGNNKVLELIMTSLSEFSTTEVRSIRPFEAQHSTENVALLPINLAESSVFSKGFQSSMILSRKSKGQEVWAAEFGSILGLLWKTNFDLKRISRNSVVNQIALNDYLAELSFKGNRLLDNFDSIEGNCFRNLIDHWGTGAEQ